MRMNNDQCKGGGECGDPDCIGGEEMPPVHVITVGGPRRNGKTTALLDIAMANARRGGKIDFWSHSQHASDEAFTFAQTLMTEMDRDVEVTLFDVPGQRKMLWFEGTLRFRFHGDDHDDWTTHGIRLCDMEIDDDEIGDSTIERRQW